MRNTKTIIMPDKHERVCYNCKYVLWLVGLGLGVRCGYEHITSEEKEEKKSMIERKPTPIPHLRHTCERFEFKQKLNALETN